MLRRHDGAFAMTARRRSATPSTPALANGEPAGASGLAGRDASDRDPIAEENAALRRRIADLERSLSEQGRDRDEVRRRAGLEAVRPRWLVLWLLLTALAAVGPVLVVADRWGGMASVRLLARGAWCRSAFLCASVLPSYVLLVGLAAAVLAAAAVALRPSPDLVRATMPADADGAGSPPANAAPTPATPDRPVPVGRSKRLSAYWRGHGERFIRLAVLQLALLTALFGLYGAREPALAPLILAVGMAWLFRDGLRRAGPVFWLTALALVLGARHIDGWWFAVIGDEYGYYDLARDVALHMPLTTVLANLADSNWSFGSYPFGSTLVQAAFMRLFGAGNFGWRIGGVATAALSLPLLAVFYGGFLRRGVAAAAVALLAASHYLMSFGKIGYDNLQALFALALVLAAATWSVRGRSRAGAVALGAAVGLCFYVFPGALFAPLIGGLFVLCMDRPLDRGTLRRWALAVGVALVAAAPMLAQATFWSDQRVGMLRHNSALTATGAPTWGAVAHNVLSAFAAPLYIVDESHFVAVGHLDPLSAGLMLLGLAAAIGLARRDGFARFLLVSYVVSAALVGALHGKSAPANTRMFLLLPWYAAFGAIGLAWWSALAARAWPPLGAPGRRRRLAVAVLAAVLALNLYQADVVARHRLAGRYQSSTATFLRLAMAEADRRPLDEVGPTYVFIHHPASFYVGSLRKLLAVYGLPTAANQVIGVDAAKPMTDTLTLDRLRDPRTMAIVLPDVDVAHRTPIEAALRATGKRACEWHNEADQPSFVLWLGNVYDPLCVPP